MTTGLKNYFVTFFLVTIFLSPTSNLANAAATSTSRIIYHHTDHLGGITVSTDQDGKVIETTDYLPYGEQKFRYSVQPQNEQRKYAGYERDPSTNLDYLNSRYYDSKVGRFTSQDPAFWTLPQSLLLDPQLQNSYSYGRNNPVVFVDDEGQNPVLFWLRSLLTNPKALEILREAIIAAPFIAPKLYQLITNGGNLADFQSLGLDTALFYASIRSGTQSIQGDEAISAEAKVATPPKTIPPKLPSITPSNKGIKATAQFSARTIDKAVQFVIGAKKSIDHIFGQAKHNLAPLVTKMGGQENTVRAVLNAAKDKLPSSGVFRDIPVNVAGYTVHIRGKVVDGIPRISTMFIKK